MICHTRELYRELHRDDTSLTNQIGMLKKKKKVKTDGQAVSGAKAEKDLAQKEKEKIAMPPPAPPVVKTAAVA